MSMTLVDAVEAKRRRSSRHDLILDAAEACFIRSGLHRTTMQDIAKEAAMSAGNIYRYFDSKEAIVLGMAVREQERGSAAVLASAAESEDKRAILMDVYARHFIRLSRSAAVIRVDLWGEVTRNLKMAELLRPVHEGGRAWFTGMFTALATSRACDPEALYRAVDVLLSGAIVQRATLADYDPAPIEAQLNALIDLGLAGGLPGAAPERKAELT
ncbi:MAG: TetR/AcrR family transcriptional regulator [Tardiphaga sp.]